MLIILLFLFILQFRDLLGWDQFIVDGEVVGTPHFLKENDPKTKPSRKMTQKTKP